MRQKDITESFYSPPPLPDPKPIIIMSVLDDRSDDPEKRSSAPTTPGSLDPASKSASSGESGSGTGASAGAASAATLVDTPDSPDAASGAGSASEAEHSGESETIAVLHDPSDLTLARTFDPSDPLVGIRSKLMRTIIERDAFKTSDLATQDSVIANRAKQFEAGNSEQLSQRMQALSSQLFSHTPTPSLNLDPAARAAVIEALNGDAPSWFKSTEPTHSKGLEQPATKLAVHTNAQRDFWR